MKYLTPSFMLRPAQKAMHLRSLCLLLCLFVSAGCQADDAAAVTPEESTMWMSIGEHSFAITLTDNPTARALTAQLPLTLDMSELNGNEKHARLPKALPTDASRAGAIRSGDLMLFGSNTLVIFYSSLNSSYSYTRLGRVNDPAALAQALGRGNVSITFFSHTSSN